MRTFTKSEAFDGDYILPPEGTQGAVLSCLAFLGSHESSWNGEIRMREIVGLQWELSEPGPEGKVLSVTETLTASTNEKSIFYTRLLALMGGREPPPGFDLSQLLGRGAVITITHAVKGDRTYANVTGVSPLLRGMQAPTPSVQPTFYDLLADHEKGYNQLPPRFKKMADKGVDPRTKPAPQQQHDHRQAAQQATQAYYSNQQARPPARAAAPAGEQFDDDIPF